MVKNQRAFTLIELMAVMIIIGLLAGAVTIRLVGMLDQRTLEDGSSVIRHLDGLIRTRSGNTGKTLYLRFEFTKQSISIQDNETLSNPWNAGNLRILEVRMPSGRFSEGDVAVPCSGSGITPSYGVHLSDQSGQRSTWIVVAGLSGDTKEVANENVLNEIFKTEARHDTH